MRGRAVRHLAAAPSAERGVGPFYSNFPQAVLACLNGGAHASAACTVPFRYARDVSDQVRRESSQRVTTPVCRE